MWLNRKALRWTGFTVLSIMTAVAVLAVAEWVERVRCADEEDAVYSTYLSEGLLNDAHDWSAGGPVRLVVRSTTSVGERFRIKVLYVFDSRAGFDQLDRSTWASYLVQNVFPTRILPKISLPRFATLSFTTKSDYSSAEFQKEFPANQGLTVLSSVGFNSDRTQAVFYIDHFCGLCGGGRYVLMTKTNGAWHATDEHWTWIS